jgi:hypothetical protein
VKRFLVIAIILLLPFAVMATGCTNNGIPWGTYESCDENGNIHKTDEQMQIHTGGKATWIYLGDCKIIETGDELYLEFARETDYKYKIDYNKKTKIITVYRLYMDSIDKTYYFKKSGWW